MQTIPAPWDTNNVPRLAIPTFNPEPSDYLDELGYIVDLYNSQDANLAYVPRIVKGMLIRRGINVVKLKAEISYQGGREDFTSGFSDHVRVYAHQHGYDHAPGVDEDTSILFKDHKVCAVVHLWNGQNAEGATDAFITAERALASSIKDYLESGRSAANTSMTRYYMTIHSIAESIVTFSRPDMSVPSKLLWPYLEYTPEEMIERFLTSSANVLVLLGAPGTGKTSYVKRMLEHAVFPQRRSAVVVDSPAVMRDDGLITKIHTLSKGSLVLFEDVDEYLRPRTDGNDSMSSLLNAAEGIASPGVKFVITTNLANIGMMDAAIHRPGRCYDKLTFLKLNCDQQTSLSEYMGITLHPKDATLAEVTSTHIHSSSELKAGYHL